MRGTTVFSLVCVGVMVVTAGIKASEPRTAAELQREAEHDRVAQARRLVLAELRDPDSARFGEVFAGRGGSVCGYVNARNGFGGYTGLQPFVASGRDVFWYTGVGRAIALEHWTWHCG